MKSFDVRNHEPIMERGKLNLTIPNDDEAPIRTAAANSIIPSAIIRCILRPIDAPITSNRAVSAAQTAFIRQR